MAGISSGVAATFSFNVSVLSTGSCGNYDIQSQVKRTGTPLTCTPPSPATSYTCTNNSNVILGTSANVVTVLRPKVIIPVAYLQSGNLQPGQTVVFSVTASDTSTTISAPANSLTVNFYCGTSGVPFTSQLFPQDLPTGGTLVTNNFTVSIPAAPTCGGGQNMSVAIVPFGSNCVCDSAGYTFNSVLPVTLTNFTAMSQNNTVHLNWQIANQVNVDHYEVLVGSNINNLKNIGKVLATANSNSYIFDDANPAQGINYYRLKIVDLNGAVSYSEIRTVNFGNGSGVIIYPNPAKNNINISMMGNMVNKPGTITVFAMEGKQVLQIITRAMSQTETLDVNNLAAGKYLIRIVTDTEVITKTVEIVR